MAGKGDKARPIPDRATFESNWERIFKEKQKDTVPTQFNKDKGKPDEQK